MATEAEMPRILPHNSPVDRGGAAKPMRFLDFLVLLAEGKRLLGVVVLLFLVAGVLLALLLPVRYTATVVILPRNRDRRSPARLLRKWRASVRWRLLPAAAWS